MNEKNYNDEVLIDRNWPSVNRKHDGYWHATWSFKLDGETLSEINSQTFDDNASEFLSSIVRDVTKSENEKFLVSFRLDGKLLQVDTRTTSHLIGSENLKAIFELFVFIDSRIGAIQTIQSQPRQLWPPWSKNGV